ncbi:MAG: RsmE family RNA methyltransferase [Chitinophagales bacterium]
MNVFYCPDAVLNEHVALDETESQHITRVLRKREGEELLVFDGKGCLYNTRIDAIGKREVVIHVVRLLEKETNDKPKLHIAIAPPKNIDRFEWFIEKVTEIGIHEITPVICERSERKELRIDRLDKILVSATKQSLKYTLPKLNSVRSFKQFIGLSKGVDRKYIAYCDEKAIHLKDAYHGGFDSLIMIGPEGDFSREEILLATENEFETVSLGKSRLRLETAGIYGAVVFNLANER